MREIGAISLVSYFVPLFSCHYITKEEINERELVSELGDREADAQILEKLRFTYGKAFCCKKESGTACEKVETVSLNVYLISICLIC